MKRNKLFKYAVLLAFPIACGNMLTGCTDDFETINSSEIEVNPGDLPFKAQFQEPMTYCYPPQQNMFQFWTNLSIDFYGGYFMTPNGNFGNGNYGEVRGHCGGMYENYYLHIINNTSRLIKTCEENGQNAVGALMRIVQAYGTLMTTDTYGPIAYKSVLDKTPTSATFAYDKQEDIYNYMFADLEKAVTDLKTATDEEKGILKAADFWCGGNIDLLTKVANTLKLRMAMRIVKVNPKLAETKAIEAYGGGVLTDADKDIIIDQGLENEMWLMISSWGDCGFNASLVTIMDGFKDPRQPLYMTKNTEDILKDGYSKAKDDNKNDFYYKTADKDKTPVAKSEAVLVEKDAKYLGMRIGSGLPAKPNAWGNFSGWVGNYTMGLPIMKVAEAYFLRAEGALRGWNMGGTPQSLYEQGIRTSIKNELKYKGSYAGVKEIDDVAIDAYINGTTGQIDFVDPVNDENSIAALNTLGVKWDNANGDKEKQLQLIITQKWIANFPLSNEAWAEYRRTGYPKLFPVRVNNSDGNIDTNEQIRRSIYGATPYDTNEAELNKGIELLNQENSSTKFSGDHGGTRLWWDRADKGNF